jgi:hypothetical protein
MENQLQSQLVLVKASMNRLVKKLYLSSKNDELNNKYILVRESLDRILDDNNLDENLKMNLQNISELVEMLIKEGGNDLVKDVLFHLIHLVAGHFIK